MVLVLDLVPVNDTEAEGIPLKSLELGTEDGKNHFLPAFQFFTVYTCLFGTYHREGVFRHGGVEETL